MQHLSLMWNIFARKVIKSNEVTFNKIQHNILSRLYITLSCSTNTLDVILNKVMTYKKTLAYRRGKATLTTLNDTTIDSYNKK